MHACTYAFIQKNRFSYFYNHIWMGSLDLIPTRGRGFPQHSQAIPANSRMLAKVSKNSAQFWYCLSGDKVRFHRQRAQSHKTALLIRCQKQAQVTCASDHLATDWRSQRPRPTQNANSKFISSVICTDSLAINQRFPRTPSLVWLICQNAYRT